MHIAAVSRQRFTSHRPPTEYRRINRKFFANYITAKKVFLGKLTIGAEYQLNGFSQIISSFF